MITPDHAAVLARSRMPIQDAALPATSGVYGIYLTLGDHIAGIPTAPDNLVYIGASQNLLQRDVDTHFVTGKSGFSTLRRTIGALLKQELRLHAEPRSSGPSKTNTTNYRFREGGEGRLTAWMAQHLQVGFVSVDNDVIPGEKQLVRELKPPLNLTGWDNPYRTRIKQARTLCREEAQASRARPGGSHDNARPRSITTEGARQTESAECSGRYALKSTDERERRHRRLVDDHIAPLEQLAATIRATLAKPTDVPSFDPCDGGIHADLLLLLEAPGKKAVETGFVSMNNPDRTAANLLSLLQEAGIDRQRVLMWNIVPWYLGTRDRTKIRAAKPSDVANASIYLETLVTLLPELQACVLFGQAAQRAEPLLQALVRVPVFRSPHPSPVAFGVNPTNRDNARTALTEAVSSANQYRSSAGPRTVDSPWITDSNRRSILENRVQLPQLVTEADGCLCLELGPIDGGKLKVLRDHGYDQAPVIGQAGRPIGVVETSMLGILSQQNAPLTEGHLTQNRENLPALLQLGALLDYFSTNRAGLVFDGDRWVGLMTMSDLNRHVFRAMLYQELATFEARMAQLVEETFDDPWEWLKYVNDYDRVQLVGNWEVMKHNGTDLGPAQAATLVQLLKVVRGDRSLRKMCGFKSANQAKKATSGLPDVRNAVMHPVRPLVLSPGSVEKISHALSAIDTITNNLEAPSRRHRWHD